MLRQPLPGSRAGSATLAFDDFICENVTLISEKGASGLVYSAVSPDFYGTQNAAPAHLIIKECYPVEICSALVRQGDELCLTEGAGGYAQQRFQDYLGRYDRSFSTHTFLYQNGMRDQVTVPKKTYYLNGTAYIVSDASDGRTLESVVGELNARARVAVVGHMGVALATMHKHGLLYLDLKPSNILVSSLGTADRFVSSTLSVKLFDFDTVVDVDGEESAIPCSGAWASYEQSHPDASVKLDESTDYYSLGVLLFWMMFGRPPASEEVIHADGNWNFDARFLDPAFAECSSETLAACRAVLNRTLTVDQSKRYRDSEEVREGVRVILDSMSAAPVVSFVRRARVYLIVATAVLAFALFLVGVMWAVGDFDLTPEESEPVIAPGSYALTTEQLRKAKEAQVTGIWTSALTGYIMDEDENGEAVYTEFTMDTPIVLIIGNNYEAVWVETGHRYEGKWLYTYSDSFTPDYPSWESDYYALYPPDEAGINFPAQFSMVTDVSGETTAYLVYSYEDDPFTLVRGLDMYRL